MPVKNLNTEATESPLLIFPPESPMPTPQRTKATSSISVSSITRNFLTFTATSAAYDTRSQAKRLREGEMERPPEANHASTQDTLPVVVKRKRGRPAGLKNKPKQNNAE